MARQINREELVDIAKGINSDVEELNGCINELKNLETEFTESWNDTNAESKAGVCLENIQNVEVIVQNSISLSEGVSALYIEDAQTGGDF